MMTSTERDKGGVQDGKAGGGVPPCPGFDGPVKPVRCIPGGDFRHYLVSNQDRIADVSERSDQRTPAPGIRTDSRAAPRGKERISAVVVLSLLEVIRARDLPEEVLAAEDPTQTMPRRLGLRDAVEQLTRRYREEVRRGGRITDDQARDMFRLVLRRPDSEEVFFQAGELLARRDAPLRGVTGWYPRKVLLALARRRIRRRVRALFGREIGGFAQGPFALEARGHLLLEMDPGGDACTLLSGISASILSRYLRRPVWVAHRECQALKGELCRWTMEEEGEPPGG